MSDRLNRVDSVIQKYRLAERTVIDGEENGVKLGEGQIMDPATLKRFIQGDPSGNFKYLDWMLFIAGGGQEAMEKSLQLWEGEGESDPNSLRNQCRMDFVEEQTKGYSDEAGRYHPPVTRNQAEEAWRAIEARSKFEFVMGDQDVASEEGYGFYRHWPGKNKLYEKIVNAVRLWHMAQPKLLAQNQRLARFKRLNLMPGNQQSADDKAFLRKYQNEPVATEVNLDIYAGWKPKEYGQSGAVYKTLRDLLRTLADVRKMQVLRDIRFEKIFEDERVLAICPLTIGASIKFGIGKWCVSNKSEFDRSFDSNGVECNWQRYNKQGPLVFMVWKMPMPAFLHRIALHIPMDKLKHLTGTWQDVSWVDCQNQQAATSFGQVMERIMFEHRGGVPLQPTDSAWGVSSSADELYYKWGGRRPGPAWHDSATAKLVEQSMFKVLGSVRRWAPGFQPERVVLDFITDIGGVDNVND